jgi:hypothetical protein
VVSEIGEIITALSTPKRKLGWPHSQPMGEFQREHRS